MSQNAETPLGGAVGWIFVIAGAIVGIDIAGFIGAIVGLILGAYVGAFVERLVYRLLYVAFVIGWFLLRQEIFAAVFGG